MDPRLNPFKILKNLQMRAEYARLGGNEAAARYYIWKMMQTCAYIRNNFAGAKRRMGTR